MSDETQDLTNTPQEPTPKGRPNLSDGLTLVFSAAAVGLTGHFCGPVPTGVVTGLVGLSCFLSGMGLFGRAMGSDQYNTSAVSLLKRSIKEMRAEKDVGRAAALCGLTLFFGLAGGLVNYLQVEQEERAAAYKRDMDSRPVVQSDVTFPVSAATLAGCYSGNSGHELPLNVNGTKAKVLCP